MQTILNAKPQATLIFYLAEHTRSDYNVWHTISKVRNVGNETDKILARIRKIQALAKRGEGGEKVNAERQLQKMLSAHNLSLSDLLNDKKKWCTFSYESEFECRLLDQIVAMVSNVNDVDVYRHKNDKNTRVYELSPAQSAEVSTYYSVYKKALQEHLDIAYEAFLIRQDIYPATPTTTHTEPDAQAMAAYEMSRTMSYVSVKKQITKD